MAEGCCDKSEYTDSNIRCLKCVSVVIRMFPTIMHRIMDHSGTTPQSIYQRIQKDTQFRNNLKPEEHQVLQTLLTDGYDKLDLTLSFKLITHYSNMFINSPTRGWSSNPGPSEVTIGDDVQRLRLIRNHFLHKVEIELSEHKFDDFFKDTSSICERIDKHLNCVESFKTCIENMKTKQLIGINELHKLYQEEKALKELFFVQIERNSFKVYVSTSLSSFIQQFKEKEQDEGEFVSVNLTFPEISNTDFVRVMNELREEINNGQVNIIIDNFKEGSLVLDIRIRAAVVMDDLLLVKEIKLLLMRLYKSIRTALDSDAKVNVVLSKSLAVFSDDVQKDDNEEETRMYPEGCLQLRLKVKKNIIKSEENLKSELKTLFETIASKGNGHEIFPVDKPVVSIMEPSTEECEQVHLTCEFDPCKRIGKNAIQAQFFCNQCEEKYCEVCHQIQRATKEHKVVRLADFTKTVKYGSYKKGQNRSVTECSTHDCEPCQARGKTGTKAKLYCNNCNEKYCEPCSSSHKSEKATKWHDIVDIKYADYRKQKKQCDPCQFQKRSSEATFACIQCEEFVCSDCKIVHLSQRQNKNHQIMTIKEDLNCQPCAENNKMVQAIGFCEDCEEPELLCLVCWDNHKAMKRTRNHRIKMDTAEYSLKYENRDRKEALTTISGKANDRTNCDPCEFNGQDRVAEMFCRECEEAMCPRCFTKHLNVKQFADHNIENINKMLQVTIPPLRCDPCKFYRKETDATHKCEECNEYLCRACKNDHLVPKRNRTHAISEIGSEKKTFACGNCQSEASFFCKDCRIPICIPCTGDHKAMKATRNHELSSHLMSCVLRLSSDAAKREAEEKNNERPAVRRNYSIRLKKSKINQPCCEPCKNEGKTSQADYLCVHCDENMCATCLEFHNAEPDNKVHIVSNTVNKALICNCGICEKLKKENPASCYCIDCTDPIPLCKDCAKKHLNMKKTREHRISSDMEAFKERMKTMKDSDSKKPMQTKDEMTLPQPAEKENYEEGIGKPYASERKSDEIFLQWNSTRQLTDTEVYNIMLKEYQTGKWKHYTPTHRCSQPKMVITGLKPDTAYVFKVRVLDEAAGKEGPYTEESELITTKESPALYILKKSQQTDDGPPKIYRLPIEENVGGRNEKSKTRKFTLGKPGKDVLEKERTIMILGATGCGKSTLINGMANYIMGVTWEDPFRFTLINLEASEKEKVGNQALSQTDWVTCYTIHTSVSDRIDYTINLIDTPGFGDTRGLDQDEVIVDQIRQLFTAKGEKGVATIDAVCFILKAPDARLTTTQRYIFESILALFGNDIKDNICTLVTFADGQRPPVLSGIQAIEGVPLPYETYFSFNNSALFVDNSQKSEKILSSFFWDMGIVSCKSFFDHVTTLHTKSLSLTSEVLLKRETLGNTIRNLQEEIEVGLSRINILEKEIKLFTENAEAILANQEFEYSVEEQYQEKIDLTGKSQYTTNCLQCNYTCHENCAYANDNDKARCCAMNSDGKCNECPKACHWTSHHNTPYIIKWSKKTVKKRYDDMKKKYEDATQKSLSQEQVLKQMVNDVSQIETHVQAMVEEITDLNNRLKEIALRPDPLSAAQYIELMIQSELREKKSGFEDRVASLEKCKKRAQYGEDVQIFNDRVQHTRKAVLTRNGKFENDNNTKDKKGKFWSFINFFKII